MAEALQAQLSCALTCNAAPRPPRQLSPAGAKPAQSAQQLHTPEAAGVCSALGIARRCRAASASPAPRAAVSSPERLVMATKSTTAERHRTWSYCGSTVHDCCWQTALQHLSFGASAPAAGAQWSRPMSPGTPPPARQLPAPPLRCPLPARCGHGHHAPCLFTGRTPTLGLII